MIGAIYGDIAGSKYEFDNIKTKDFDLLTDDCYFTDDTVCTVAFMDWLLHAPIKNEESATKYLHRWTINYPNRGYGGNFYIWIHSSNPTPYNSYGNGAAMRISSIAWAAKDLDELKFLSDTATKITHGHIEGLKGALVTATCIYMARHKASKEEIREYLIKEYPEAESFSYEYLHQTFRFNETCQKTVPQAIYCFLISESFEDCIKTTISIGGDCDTTAAISGAIAEAYYGVNEEQINKAKSFLSKEMVDIIDEFDRKYMQ